MRRFCQPIVLTALLIAPVAASAQPAFVNGLVIPGNTLDATRQPGANAGRLGFFSDIYYDPWRQEWWALSDRGPGGGLYDYSTRVQRFTLNVHPVTGRISQFRVKDTIKFTDPKGLLSVPWAAVGESKALNGLNPLALNGDAGTLGRSFDPEGLVVDPRTGHLIVADEYGPVVYEFSRRGTLLRVFQTPPNLVPRVGDGAIVNYVAVRDDDANFGRQDNRGYEGIAITPDGKRLVAVLQDPLVNEGPRTPSQSDDRGRDGRNLRIVVFDNDWFSPSYGTSTVQYAYQLEAQADVAARIIAAGGAATATDPRQGRNIGLSAIVALNDHEFFVLERDNRGIGVDDPRGANVVGSKRVYKIDLDGATNVAGLDLPDDGNLAGAGIVPVSKSSEVFVDLTHRTSLPRGKQAEKWEGMTIGPRLLNGGHMLLFGNDNDYSVTQTGSGEQLDVYVNFNGQFAKCPLDQQMLCQLNDTGTFTEPVPAGHALIPGVLHAYKASAGDLSGYRKPQFFFGFHRFRHFGWFGFGGGGWGGFDGHDPYDDCDDHD